MAIDKLCNILSVSRSGYYKWLDHEPTPRQRENEELMEKIKEKFNQMNGIWGYRRITMYINRTQDKTYNKKRIRRLMLKMGLKSHIRRSNGYSTQSSYRNIEPNRLDRDFTADKPNEKWVTDITHLHYGLGKKAYLSVIKDLYDGSVVACHTSRPNDNPLVMATLDKAVEANPEAEPLIHSDRGSQYTSKEYRQKTTKAGMTRSMSRTANCIDNASIESFFGHFKCEKYELNTYLAYKSLTNDIDNYMKFYNEERYQETLNSLTPLEFRDQAAA